MTDNNLNAISDSLMNRKIYRVCDTARDTVAAFHDALYRTRCRHYQTGKTVHVQEAGAFFGLSGEVSGKMNRKHLKWKKTVGKQILEWNFTQRKQKGVEFRTPDGILRCRVFLDREQNWVRSEYYAPENPMRATLSYKPDPTRDAVLRFEYNHSTGTTRETVLLPVPYAFQTPEQSLQNARFGENLFLVSNDRGEFAYCPKDEQQKRLAFLEETRSASVLLSMGWEVQDGDIAADPAPALRAPEEKPSEREPDYIFENIEEAVRVETSAEEPSLLEELLEEASAVPAEPTAEPETDAPAADEALVSLGITAEEAGYVRSVLDRLLQKPEMPHTAGSASAAALVRRGEEVHYTGTLENGKREGHGRTETAGGITLYEGEYKNDLRDGFGSHHYASGAVSYIGDFKEDKREGFGVSFRESDHAMHISRWADNKPQGYATLFDPDGTMRFTGKIVEGKKQGAGISVDPENDTVFVAKYKDNEMTGEGALFAGDGSLLYAGGWKDGKRNGYGTEFDKNGDVVYAGDWKDDRYLNGVLYKKVQGDPEHGSN